MEASETTKAARGRAPRGSGPAPPFGVQFPILFIVFLFFAAGDLFALHTIKFGEGKYLAYRATFREAAATITGREELRPEADGATDETTEIRNGTQTRQSARPGPVAFIVFGILYLPALILTLWRRDWPALGFGMAALHALGLAILNGHLALGLEQYVNYAFGMALPVSFGWLVLRGKVWSRAHGGLLVVTYPFVLAISPADGSVLWTQVLPFLSLHLSFVLLLLLLRTVWLIFVENLYVVRQLGLEEFGRITGRTLQKWSPILLFALPYFILSYAIEREVKLTAYEQRLMRAQLGASAGLLTRVTAADAACPQEQAARPVRDDGSDGTTLAWRDISGRDLEADTLRAITAHFEEKIAEWCGLIGEYRAELSNRDPRKFSHFVGESYDRVFTPGLGLKPPKHRGFWSFITKPAAQATQNAVEQAYNRKHRATRKNLVREADKYERDLQQGKMKAEQMLNEFEAQGIAALVEARKATLASVQGGFFISRAFDWLSFLLLCVLCVRTLFYVFSRVACARDAGTFITLGDPEGQADMPTGEIAGRGAKLSLTMNPGETFYVARRFQPHGKAPKYALPQSSAAPLSRLRNGCYTMNAFTRREGRAPIQITATRGAQFVEWQLAEGESVVFSYRNFVGMSAGVRLSALISARVTSQVFGRFIFPTATGPGRLILMTEGAPHVGVTEAEVFSMPPSRLVAWQQSARFHIDSELALLDIYFSEAYVEPEVQTALVMDVDRQDGFGTGLVRFVRRFLLPA